MSPEGSDPPAAGGSEQKPDVVEILLGESKDVAPVEDRAREAKTLIIESAADQAKTATGQKKTDWTVQKIVGYGSLGLAGFQVLLADVVFLIYCAVKGFGNVSDGVMQVWLGATVVQVIGVVLAVTRSVFPEHGRDRK